MFSRQSKKSEVGRENFETFHISRATACRHVEQKAAKDLSSSRPLRRGSWYRLLKTQGFRVNNHL